MSEPGTGSDISGLSTRAERDGEDWLITGNKYWCTNADGADAILVLARTEPVDAAKPHKGISAFLVEKPRGSLPNNCAGRSEEHTSEIQSLMRISYAVFCLKKNKQRTITTH